MANLLINKWCNLNCPYCFLKGTALKQNDTMSVENFIKVMKFLKDSGENTRIGICGGEPTIHPNFADIMCLSFANFKYVQLYTNGINLDKYFDILVWDKLAVLLNFNSPKDIGIDNYRRLRQNIDYLIRRLGTQCVTLGLNIYTNNIEDYSYAFPVFERYNIDHMRVSVCVPITQENKHINPLDYFKSRHDIIKALLVECYKRNIQAKFDCNFPPACIFTDEDIKEFRSYGSLFDESDILEAVGCYNDIMPLDILPDLTVSRCFGLDRYMARPLDSFKNLREIYEYFYRVISIPASKIMPDEKCFECEYYKEKGCICGCLTYKLDKLKEMQEKGE